MRSRDARRPGSFFSPHAMSAKPSTSGSIQHLVSLPPRMAKAFGRLEHRSAPEWIASHDPEGGPLGSGGGTVHLLVEAWRTSAPDVPFAEWLGSDRKLILHAGGQSRRLPAYSAVGKVLLPMPAFRWTRGQRLDQTLLDIQLPHYHSVLSHAPDGFVAMVTCGDVLLRFGANLPRFPSVDILCLGMWTSPEIARDFGVLFAPSDAPEQLAFCLQKPAPERIRERLETHLFFIDTGMWLFSARAVERLLARSGWNAAEQRFLDGAPAPFELYSGLGLALGTSPTRPDPVFADLTSAVVSLPAPEFLHFGTSRQLIESISELQNREPNPGLHPSAAYFAFPNQHLQNSRVTVAIRREENSHLWIENSVISAGWKLAREHVLTGVPDNDWSLTLEPGVCLDFVPVGNESWAVRSHGMDDRFAGPWDASETLWFGRPAADWFQARGIDPAEAGLTPGTDLQRAPLFPVLAPDQLDGAFLEWLFARAPRPEPLHARRWVEATRYSAARLQAEIDLDRLYDQRARRRAESLLALIAHRDRSVFHRLDLDHSARLFAATGYPEPLVGSQPDGLARVHDAMFVSGVLRHRGRPDWQGAEQRAFAILRDVIVRESQLSPALPRAGIVEDQIVWARSPVRLDLAGGWTDTPPYCLEHGGQVVNVAIDLNGQPPIQVFCRLCPRPEIVLRSIDLGVEQRVRTYEELDGYAEPGNSFALAKAACALAGFLPRFHARGGHGSLVRDLEAFGGGIELTLLSAVPKGSGLGTSSILASTVLGALSEVCSLDWDRHALFTRTLALEQMMTTGGGWQDQAGGIHPGIKLVETPPGLAQIPRIRWLPEHLFGPAYANQRLLLYYTGVTRLAKGILAEIVRGIFLNASRHLATLDEIAASARTTALAIEHRDYAGLAASIDRTWQLKQRLDAGTNPPSIQSIIETLGPGLLAAALPGAGGGGYLLLAARDEDAALRIRRKLEERPPNPRARFVDFSVSDTGLQITRS